MLPPFIFLYFKSITNNLNAWYKNSNVGNVDDHKWPTNTVEEDAKNHCQKGKSVKMFK